MQTATAQAHPNTAIIKYWDNQDQELRIPSNSSLSMNLASLHSTTKVTFNPALKHDILVLNRKPAEEAAAQRVSTFLDRVRKFADLQQHAEVVSQNNFPTGAGIASSASAIAALALAASTAAGFVEWQTGDEDESSFALPIAPPDH